MSEYTVYFRNNPDNIIVDIPDIYRDCESETNSEQIREYLCKTLDIDFYSLIIDIKRESRLKRKIKDIIINDGDELYISLINKKNLIDVNKLKLKSGFVNTNDSQYSLQNFTESDINEISIEVDEYYKKLNIVLNDLREYDEYLEDCLIKIIKYQNFPLIFPLNVIDNIWFFCNKRNGIIDNNGFCYDHVNKIYYEGYIKENRILNGKCLNLKERYFSFNDMYVNFKESVNGYKKYIDKNEIYEGYFHEGLYSGGGMLKNDLGIYHGIFRNGIFNSYGSMKYTTGDIYVGYWYDGKYNIFGKMIYANGDYYSGVWNNGLKDKFGVLYDHKTNTTYNGTFKDDKRTFNKHEFKILDGQPFYSNIIGEYSIEMENINEIIRYKNHNIIYNDQNLMISSYENIDIEEIGNNRQKFYIGHYDFTQQIYGFGILFFNKKNKIISNNCDDTIIYSSEYFLKKYKGFRTYYSLFSDGCPDSFGLIEFENGDKYIGDIKNGQVTGYGTLFKNNGNVVRAFWNENSHIYDIE